MNLLFKNLCLTKKRTALFRDCFFTLFGLTILSRSLKHFNFTEIFPGKVSKHLSSPISNEQAETINYMRLSLNPVRLSLNLVKLYLNLVRLSLNLVRLSLNLVRLSLSLV